MAEDKITKEQFYNWKQHPVTQEFFKELFNERESVKEALVRAEGLDISNAESTVSNTWLAIGIVRGIDFVLQTEFGDEEEPQ